jgi:hypothetical protein
VTTAFVSRPPPCTGGNEARGIFSRKLDSGDGGERPRGAPLARGEGSRLSTELLDRGAWPSRGLPFDGISLEHLEDNLLLTVLCSPLASRGQLDCPL